jgi:hypothetical protein
MVVRASDPVAHPVSPRRHTRAAVATNDPYHVESILVALKYGKSVLVEKPLCQSVDDA